MKIPIHCLANCMDSPGLEIIQYVGYSDGVLLICPQIEVSWLLGIVLKMGVIGIAIAMVCDWSIRAVIFFRRQKSGKWKTFQVI